MKNSVEKRGSLTAKFVSFCRACSYKEKSEFLHSNDYLAKNFNFKLTKVGLKLSRLIFPIVRKVVPGTYEWVIARTRYLDEIVKKISDNSFSQLIVLGAGFDTRALRFRELLQNIDVYEVDAPKTQNQKLKILNKKEIEILKNVHYVSVNFNTQQLDTELINNGFKENRKNLIIWEGVTGYLQAEAIDETLNSIRQISAKGSQIAFTYLIGDFSCVENNNLSRKEKNILKFAARLGEPFCFAIPEGTIGNFLNARGYKLIEDKTAQNLDQDYFKIEDGKYIGHVTRHSAIALAEIM